MSNAAASPILHFETAIGPPLPLESPFRGTLVIGAAGSGKTAAIARPVIAHYARQNAAGLVYGVPGADPASCNEAVRSCTLNFESPGESVRLNPWEPQQFVSPAYAMQAAQVLLGGLSESAGSNNDNFFARSAQSFLAGIIWYYRNNHPAFCTVPHVVATACHRDFQAVLGLLRKDAGSEVLVRSLITAVDQGAVKQVAGVLAALQIDLTALLDPAITWVLSPNPLADNAISLALNDVDYPTLLTVCPPVSRNGGFRAAISCVVASALRHLNRPGQYPSYVLLDSAENIYVPDLDRVAATSRSNKLPIFYLTQDMRQLIAVYGKDRALVLVSSLNNQFFGKVTSAETAELVAATAGISTNEDGAPNQGTAERISAAYSLRENEFLGRVEATHPISFHTTLVPLPVAQAVADTMGTELPVTELEENFQRVVQQVEAVINPPAEPVS